MGPRKGWGKGRTLLSQRTNDRVVSRSGTAWLLFLLSCIGAGHAIGPGYSGIDIRQEA